MIALTRAIDGYWFFAELDRLGARRRSGRWWVYGVPLLSVLAIVTLFVGGSPKLTAFFAAGAAALLLLFFYQLFRRQREEHFIVMKLSAALLLCGNLLWVFDSAIYRIVPWWAGFLVVMIAGERLELTRLRRPPSWVRLSLRIALLIFVAGLALTLFDFRLGVRMAGAGLIGIALWLLRYDLAWQSIKLPGFAALHGAGPHLRVFLARAWRCLLDLVRALFWRWAALRCHAAHRFCRFRVLDDLRPCANHITDRRPDSPCRSAIASISMPAYCIYLYWDALLVTSPFARRTKMGRPTQRLRRIVVSVQQYSGCDLGTVGCRFNVRSGTMIRLPNLSSCKVEVSDFMNSCYRTLLALVGFLIALTASARADIGQIKNVSGEYFSCGKPCSYPPSPVIWCSSPTCSSPALTAQSA
jgi:hypothetical protein